VGWLLDRVIVVILSIAVKSASDITANPSGFITVMKRLSTRGLMRALPRDVHYIGLYLGHLFMGLNHEPQVASRVGPAERGPNPGPGS